MGSKGLPVSLPDPAHSLQTRNKDVVELTAGFLCDSGLSGVAA